MWIVRLGDDTYGPFDTYDDAIRWALALLTDVVWIAEPLRKPEDVPGSQLDAPPEPDLPLLEGLEP